MTKIKVSIIKTLKEFEQKDYKRGCWTRVQIPYRVQKL